MSVTSQPTDEVITDYTAAFFAVYGQEPRIHFVGNQWYQVNGHPVHRTVLEGEIHRLRDLAHLQETTQQHIRTTAKRSAIQRLISKLRGV